MFQLCFGRKTRSAVTLGVTALLLLSLVPRAGVEPARVAPLVFETSASTDSAIWASKAGAKVTQNFQTTKYYGRKFMKRPFFEQSLNNLWAFFEQSLSNL